MSMDEAGGKSRAALATAFVGMRDRVARLRRACRHGNRAIYLQMSPAFHAFHSRGSDCGACEDYVSEYRDWVVSPAHLRPVSMAGGSVGRSCAAQELPARWRGRRCAERSLPGGAVRSAGCEDLARA